MRIEDDSIVGIGLPALNFALLPHKFPTDYVNSEWIHLPELAACKQNDRAFYDAFVLR